MQRSTASAAPAEVDSRHTAAASYVDLQANVTRGATIRTRFKNGAVEKLPDGLDCTASVKAALRSGLE